MSATNKKPKSIFDGETRLAGGAGGRAAKQEPLALLRRATLACMLWEDMFYQTGKSNAEDIETLIKACDPIDVANLAVEAREVQKLRHVPLYMLVELVKNPKARRLVGLTLPRVITRADQLSEFLALYWKKKKQPLAAQVKKGLATAFQRFNQYQLSKYDRAQEIRLRDVMFLVHPTPISDQQKKDWEMLAQDTLPPADTWEVALSAAGSDPVKKKEAWERLIREKKLGDMALLRNLRNMVQVGVDAKLVETAIASMKGDWLLPINFVAAMKAAPTYARSVMKAYERIQKPNIGLPGRTVLIIDVSGSMMSPVSEGSSMSRLDVAAAMAMLAEQVCEHVDVYVTAGGWPTHKTEIAPPYSGWALYEWIMKSQNRMGGGGIFTRQALEYVRGEISSPNTLDRIMVFSDSQDCDSRNSVPNPFATYNYIIDVSAHTHGVNFDGRWTAEISGWSTGFFDFILASEGLESLADEDE